MITVSFHSYAKDSHQHDAPVLPIYHEMIRQKEALANRGVRGVWWEEGAGYYYVHCDACPNPPDRGIYHFHGIGAHEGSPFKDSSTQKFWLGVLVPGPYTLNLYKTNWSEEYHNRFKMVGWPKSDLLFSPEQNEIKNYLAQELSLPYDKTLLWADTAWQTPLSIRFNNPYYYKLTKTQFLHKIYAITNELQVNLIIKPWYGAGEGGNDCLPPKSLERNWVRWVDPRDPDFRDVTRLFLVADLLIGDGRSSTTTEFMVTGKPVLKFVKGKAWWRPSARWDKVGNVGIDFVDFECDLNTLKQGIKYALENPDENRSKRIEWVCEHIYKPDGHAAERAVEAICELVGK